MNAYLSWCLFFVRLSTLWLANTPHRGLYDILLQFHFLFKILQHPFPFWSNSPAALYCLRHCPYSLCPTFSSLAGSPVTVAWVVVIEELMHCLFLPKYTGILYIYTLELQSLWILIPNILCFFGMYCLKMTAVESHHTESSSTAKCSVGLQYLAYWACPI